ncbi:MAG: DUF1836 domain-containing protein [Clostridia bacterium]|nr:DUF1836 domain-containing protein [Clostridia bacterium]
MNNNIKELMGAILKNMAALNYIKPGDVPNINLYMDQVTTFMYEHLHDTKRTEDDKVLTKTMINNYAKNNLLPSPVKKKYSKEHIYILTFIYYFKNILSISDIQKMLNPLTDKFFSEDSKPDLDYIYNEIFSMEESLVKPLTKDVLSKSQQASEAFSDVENEDDREFLQFFSLVCLLSFDVYMKKNMIESLIDDYSAKHTPKQPEKSKESKKDKEKDSETKETTKK